jgi:uncharacterized membrane protein YphA (DoxX/SURF4 family)
MVEKRLPGIFLHISRIITGTVLVYSGFVKGIDPLGSTYKFIDYFVAFNVEFMEPLALPLSILLSSAELLLGVMLLAGIHMVLASWAALLFMGFFTFLTLFIALTDPVSDCGCFGDAIILTNWETFFKNVILMVFVIYLFSGRKKFGRFFSKRSWEWGTLALLSLAVAGISLYSYMNLPLIDFRPFSTGTDIPEKMSIPPDAPADEYEITLYYEKDGEVRAFSVDEIPDSSWEWVRTESTLVSKGYEPPITSFSIESRDGYDLTWNILEDEGYTFLLISYNLDRASEKNINRINSLARWSAENNAGFIALTASTDRQIDNFIERTGASYEFGLSDEITLKTIIRSNPGLLLLREGTIIGKWHYRNIPYPDELKDNLLSWSVENRQGSRNTLVSIGFILALLFVIALLRAIRPVAAAPAVNDEQPGSR